MFKLSFYVPESHLEEVKAALFNAGAGRYQNYDSCSWQILGEGQFRPLPGSLPFSGTIDQLHTSREYKVEMICPASLIKPVVQTLLNIHPYQQPAYEVYKILSYEEL
jgi:hypothetical protein